MMPSKAWCRSEFGGMGQALFPQTGCGVRRSWVREGHEVSVPSGDRRRQRPGVSGGVPHDSRSNDAGGVADGVDNRHGKGFAQVPPLQAAPESVAGDAESLGGLGLSVPQDVGAHVVADGGVQVVAGIFLLCRNWRSGLGCCHS